MTEDQFARFVEYAESRFQQLATKADLERFATKADLAQLAKKADLFQIEMRERFEIVHDRLVAIEKGQEELRSDVAKVRADVNELRSRIEKLESFGRDTTMKLIDLREDMQQRFRALNERLGALEQRIAA